MIGTIEPAQGNLELYFNPFEDLLSLYRNHMGKDQGQVSSGGVQQYLNHILHTDQDSDLTDVVVDGGRVTTVQPRADRTPGRRIDVTHLPLDVLLHIFSMLSPRDLCRAAATCQHWNDVASDDLLWRERLRKDSQEWGVFGHTTHPALYREVNSDLSDKEIYLRCSPEVVALSGRRSAGYQRLSNILRSFFPQKVPMLAMFGPGLESDTSGLVRSMLFEKNASFTTTGMYPGRFAGYGAGVTVRLNQTQDFHVTTLYTSNKQERENVPPGERLYRNKMLIQQPQNDRGDIEAESPPSFGLKPVIKSLCQTVDAFVFVVNASLDNTTLSTDKDELFCMISERWSAPHVPVLVLACTRDSTVARMPCIDVIDRLELSRLGRPWRAYDCTVEGLQHLPEAFEWVVEQSKNN